jgi:hypothetical protein
MPLKLVWMISALLSIGGTGTSLSVLAQGKERQTAMEALEKKIQQKFSEFSKQQDPGLIHQALDLVEAAQRDAEPSHAASCRGALSASLTFLAELDRHIDPAWDQAKDPVRGVPPPVSGVRVYGTGEIDPADIPDPAIRARYIKDLKANKDYRAYYNVQFRLRRIDERAMSFLERFIQRCYTASPQDRSELDGLLAASFVTADRRNRLRHLISRA